MRRRVPWGLVALLFVVVPLVELYIVVQASQAFGLGWTVLLLIADSVLGAVMLKREGSAAFRALRDAVSAARVPARELADGALVLVGGTLLLTPGFVTDALGFFFILPFTRPLARGVLTRFIARRFLPMGPGRPGTPGGGPAGFGGPGGPGGSGGQTGRSPGHGGVVRGDVVD